MTLQFLSSLCFFRAEDGIRGADVTGVQTCALPISPPDRSRPDRAPACAGNARATAAQARAARPRRPTARRQRRPRSEERRGGKECRARWVAYDENKHPPRAARALEAQIASGIEHSN